MIIGCKNEENANLHLSEPVLDQNYDEIIEIPDIIDPYRIIAAEIASLMDDRLLASQVLMSGIDGNSAIPPHMANLLKTSPVGGIMLFRYNLNVSNDAIRSHMSELTDLITKESGVPPFISVDHEGGLVNRFNRGVAQLPSAPSYWRMFQEKGWYPTLAKVEEDSLNAARELSDLGINMNLAPIAEYLIEENKAFLGIRSYGPNPFFTAHAALAFMNGMNQAGVLCVVKHFPGNAGADPHYHPSVLNMSKDALNFMVSPFSLLIKNGARAIMITHTLVPAIDSIVASLSPVVMRNWLRDELGFDGIIIGDDYTMASAGSLGSVNAAINSIAAGADMILVWQHELSKMYNAVTAAMKDGILTRERMEEAAARIIYEKLRMGLMKLP